MIAIQYIVMAIAALMSQAFAQSCPTISPAHAPTFASGYSGRVVMNGLQTPRGILFDNQGNILTTEQGGYGVRYIQLNDNGGTNVCAKSNKQLIADSSINHGIALTPDGKKLYVSSLNTTWSWDYDGRTGTVSNKKVVVQNMGNPGTHATRALHIPRARPDVLLVHRGSQDNMDTAAAQESTARSMIKIFKLADIERAPMNYASGETLAWGLRNTVGFGEHPDGGIWSVDNGMDDMERDGVDIHHTNPCEELNFHGRINDAASQLRGANHGYPECHAVWDPSVIPNAEALGLVVGTQFAHDNGTNDAECRTRVAPKLCFPSHTAPLGITFNKNGTAGYIAFHGSWNKSPPDGYRVSRVAFNGQTGQPVDGPTSTTAAVNIMFNPNNNACPNGCFRPVNLAWGPGNRLFMTSDTTGEIWIIGGAQ